MADLRRRTGPVLAVLEGGDGVGVRASLVVDSSGERLSEAAAMLECKRWMEYCLML